ncbi:MAG: spore maturation protein [Oscillospiraceae bacterium]|nr:spore maturation protein [Oscillospiraceae bacterium]
MVVNITGASDYILPFIAALIVGFGLFKKVPVFECFIEGAKGGLQTVYNLVPAIIALTLGVGMLSASGAFMILGRLFRPLTSLLGIPPEVLPLCLISPISGSGSITVFENILKAYGADSFPGRVASVISGSTETTFYAVTVYYGAAEVKKTRHTIPAALAGDLASFVLSGVFVRLFFGN